MRHRDPLFPDLRAPAPGPVDPVQHLLLPVGQRQLPPALGFDLVVLGERLADPAGLVVVVDGHDLATSASATRVRFIRPKL